MLAFLTDPTVVTVALGALMLGGSTGALGVFAVLRKQSLLGDVLAHAALPGIAIGFFVLQERNLIVLLGAALLSGLLGALFSLVLARFPGVQREAAMGVSLVLFFAAGLVLITALEQSSFTPSGGLQAFLFGQAAATVRSEVVLMSGVATMLLFAVSILARSGTVIAFDAEFAAARGYPVRMLEAVLTGLLAVAIVLGLQFVGVVLMAALVVAPAVAARQWARNTVHMCVLAGIIGALSGVIGAIISAAQPGLATGPVIVLVMTTIAIVALLTRRRA